MDGVRGIKALVLNAAPTVAGAEKPLTMLLDQMKAMEAIIGSKVDTVHSTLQRLDGEVSNLGTRVCSIERQLLDVSGTYSSGGAFDAAECPCPLRGEQSNEGG